MVLAASVAAAAAVVGWTTLNPGGHPSASTRPAPVESADIGELLTKVTVVDALPDVAGYERGCGIDKKTNAKQGCVFGPAWNDPTDHSGCDARDRLLAMSLHDVVFKPKTHNCKVIGGYLDPDPYTGQRVDLNHIDIDHTIPERRSWNAGAWRWTLRQRQVFANDLTELVAVSAHANRSKKDGGLDEYLPAFHPCTYIQRYLTVAVKYQLPITIAERNAAANACPAGGSHETSATTALR